MQWSDEAGGGFSTADPSRFPAQLPEGEYGPLAVNAAAQRRDPDSLLNWFERLIRRRKELPTIGFGEWRVVPTDERAVFAHRCDWEGSTVVAIHNFAPEPCRLDVSLEGCDDIVGLDDLLGTERIELDGPEFDLTLEGYGYRWFLVRRKGQRLPP